MIFIYENKMIMENKYASADLIGRLKVIYTLQMANPSIEITSMPITSRYDLRVYNPKKDKTDYLEIKDRNCEEHQYENAFLNIEKYNALSGYGENFHFVNIYTDGVIDGWQPTKMPSSGITKGEYYICKSTVVESPRIKQERYELNFNDISWRVNNKVKNIVIDDKQ